jgi:hypothetical protein
MNHLASFAFAVGLALLASVASACGGPKDGKLMVDHPMYEYQPPADLEDDDSATADDDDDGDDDDTGDEGTEE